MRRTLPKAVILALFLVFFTFKSAWAASLSLSPVSKSVENGDSFAVNVVLDAETDNVDAVDIVLDFDSDKLEYSSASYGSLFPNTVTPSIAGEQITLRATSPSAISQDGTIATITFQATAIGTAPVTFDFTADTSTDSNVAYQGEDVLTSTTNGSYTIIALGLGSDASSSPTPTPTGTAAASGNDLPETGVFTPTLLVLLIGAGLITAPLILRRI